MPSLLAADEHAPLECSHSRPPPLARPCRAVQLLTRDCPETALKREHPCGRAAGERRGRRDRRLAAWAESIPGAWLLRTPRGVSFTDTGSPRELSRNDCAWFGGDAHRGPYPNWPHLANLEPDPSGTTVSRTSGNILRHRERVVTTSRNGEGRGLSYSAYGGRGRGRAQRLPTAGRRSS